MEESKEPSPPTPTHLPRKRKRSESDVEEPVRFEDISTAAYRIGDRLERTPCDYSLSLSKMLGMEIYLKRDYTLPTGSFKERGARNTLKMMSDDERERGAIAASAGNHALGLAYHGQDLGIPITVVMPLNAPITKVQQCRDYGARVIIHGAHIGEAKDHAMQIREKENQVYVNGYDDPSIIAGAGTMGVEILNQVPDVDAVIVPVGGAGLIAGVSLAVKTLSPRTEVIGIEPEHCASLTAAMEAGRPVPVQYRPTLADGLGVPQVGPTSFQVLRNNVDAVFAVKERSIALAVLRLVELEKCVVEGGGAAGLAALLEGRLDALKGKKVVLPLCGGNIDTPVLGRVIERGLAADGRLIRFKTTVGDQPGGISKLAALLAEAGASIKDIYHERAWLTSDISAVSVKVVAETLGADHSEKIRQSLTEKGFALEWGAPS
eukprot:PLAT6925.1.p2 GENE.PLAT6925.1~~PLAT6925.1.p2  ORF type:complete len:451 (-),score=167.63 PLAT6925.1:82-1383(-)